MAKAADSRERALAAIRSEKRIGLQFKPTLLEIDADGTATIQAEVDNVAIKRLALERLAATQGVSAIVDRLRVKPAVAMSDDGILDHLRKAFYDEPSFRQLALKEREDGKVTLVREAFEDARGEIEIEVKQGVVILNGRVPGLASKRLAGVLAWWVPGSRDVINGIAVEPPEEDAPIQIEEAVRIALDKDPFVDASQVRVGVRHRTVRLTGAVHSPEARDAAEWDAWYVFGVDDVINEIVVSP
ncbi:MAG TPA: BON domain-containing protein [Methyloceanibacter sp.]|jgi:osmotically-inducible protein OsmY